MRKNMEFSWKKAQKHAVDRKIKLIRMLEKQGQTQQAKKLKEDLERLRKKIV